MEFDDREYVASASGGPNNFGTGKSNDPKSKNRLRRILRHSADPRRSRGPPVPPVVPRSNSVRSARTTLSLSCQTANNESTADDRASAGKRRLLIYSVAVSKTKPRKSQEPRAGGARGARYNKTRL